MNTKLKKKRFYGLSDLDKRDGSLSIGRFLQSWRLAEELSQKEFAEVIGISAANLCDIEKGRKGVSISKAIEIAESIGYSPTLLVQMALQELVSNAGLKLAVEVKKVA